MPPINQNMPLVNRNMHRIIRAMPLINQRMPFDYLEIQFPFSILRIAVPGNNIFLHRLTENPRPPPAFVVWSNGHPRAFVGIRWLVPQFQMSAISSPRDAQRNFGDFRLVHCMIRLFTTFLVKQLH